MAAMVSGSSLAAEGPVSEQPGTKVHGVEEEEEELDLEDPLVVAATTQIQAGFRGHLARKRVKEKRAGAEPDAADGYVAGEEDEDDEEEGIDMEDPLVHHASITIQSAFRGMQARKETQKMRRSSDAPELGEEGGGNAAAEPGGSEGAEVGV